MSGGRFDLRRSVIDSPWTAVIAVMLMAVAASATGLDNGFAYDDLVVIADNARVHELRWPWAYFGESYWGPARGDDLYRPLTILGFSLQWALRGGSPLPFHVMNVVLYAACSVGVLWLARSVMPGAAALFAALVFAAHPVHVEAVGNVVGQAELLVALVVIAAVGLYIRDRRAGPLRGRTTMWIALLYLGGLLVKEHAVVLPLLLLAAELAIVSRPRTRDDAAAVRLLLLLLTLVLVAYLTLRLSVIGRLTGDVPHPGIAELGVVGRAWVMLGLGPDLARVLLWPARLSADYSPQLVAVMPSPALAHIPAALILLVLGGLLVVSARRSNAARFGALWLAVGLLLPSNLPVPTGVLMAERTLFLPSVGLALLLGLAFAASWRSQRAWAPAARVGICAVLAMGAMRSSARQGAWQDNAAVISTMLAEAPTLYRGHQMLGQTIAVRDEFALAEPALRRAVELYPGSPVAQLDYARVLQLLGQCDRALPYFDAALRLDPASQVGQVNRAICLLQIGRLQEARLRALQGLASGESPTAYQAIRWTADSMLLAADSADSRNLFARTGREFERSGDGRVRLPIRYVLPPALESSGNMQQSSRSDSERTPK